MAEIIFTHSYLLLILPLLSFVVIAFWLAKKYPKIAGQVAIFLAALNALYSLGTGNGILSACPLPT